MQTRTIDGNAIARELRVGLIRRVAALAAGGVRPGLAVIQVGNHPASTVYVRNKIKACGEAGLYSEHIELPAGADESTLLGRIRILNNDTRIHGILVQLPLPPGLSAERVLEALVVVGRSNIVGKPMALLLVQKGATVTICNSRTPDLGAMTTQADILVVAAGKPRLVTAGMVKPGAVVIDVGINRLADGKLVGDVDFQSVLGTASCITPVPGGVGPMTIAMLLENTVMSAERASAARSSA